MSVGSSIEPFLKWAGGKRWLTNQYTHLFPRNFGRYYEPFLGSGSVFFKVAPSRATLSDVNPELVNAYQVVRDFPDRLEAELKALEKTHSKHQYYKIREEAPSGAFAQAVRFLYLNRTCWNGLYRVNKRGEFNVPIGTKTKLILPSDNFRGVARLLCNVNIRCCDFSRSISPARQGDFVYCDPPYTVKHNNNGFLKYNESIFSWDDQVRLAESLVRASSRGVLFAVSNADHESILELYAGFNIHRLNRASVISGKASGRGGYSEVLITNY